MDHSLASLNPVTCPDTSSSPFPDFLIPGIILLLTFGVFPALIVSGLLKKLQSRFFQRLNLLHDYHFAWTFSIFKKVESILQEKLTHCQA